jgi:hypothetical protein
MLKKIALVVVALLVIFVAVVAFQPSEWSVQRETVINAPAAVVYAQVNDFHKWNAWSPWDKLDPNMKREFSGAESGVGATYHWVGKEDVGEGEMKIDSVTPGSAVGIKLDFVKPFEANNHVDFALVPAEGGTRVTWKMMGHNNFAMKAFGLFMNMDKAVGGDFEKGLASLKTVSEGEAAKAAEAEKKAAEEAGAAMVAAPGDAGTP